MNMLTYEEWKEKYFAKISQESLAHAVIRNLLERLDDDEFLSIDDEILRNMIDQGEKK